MNWMSTLFFRIKAPKLQSGIFTENATGYLNSRYKDVLGVKVSEGTLYATRTQCFEDLALMETTIQAALQQSCVVHFDETGLRVNGRLAWLHVAFTNGLTYYFVHTKRGQLAMDILPKFQGNAIHDGWKSCVGYQACAYFLCNAHHLRELQFILERYQQPWVFQMSLSLVSILTSVQAAKAQGETSLSPAQLDAFAARYDEMLLQRFAANPILAPLPDTPKKRGRPKQTPPCNLLTRLRVQKAAVLGFMHDFEVPFDNNQADRDLLIVKLKQKISGSFRSTEGAQMFCRIRGYLSTLRKQSHNVLDALMALFSGHPKPILVQP